MSYIVGITGGTASGKTTVMDLLHRALPAGLATFVSLDNYYKPQHEQTEPSPRGGINFDHPNAFRLQEFTTHLEALLAGHVVEIKEYTFNNPAAEARMLTLRPAPILILEGIMVFHQPEVKQRLDLQVFVEAADHVRLARRIRRDIGERNIPLEEILDQYLLDAVPMYRQYIEPHRDECHLILPSNERLPQAVQVLVHHLLAVATPTGKP